VLLACLAGPGGDFSPLLFFLSANDYFILCQKEKKKKKEQWGKNQV
jgi:hypothetical protein